MNIEYRFNICDLIAIIIGIIAIVISIISIVLSNTIKKYNSEMKIQNNETNSYLKKHLEIIENKNEIINKILINKNN